MAPSVRAVLLACLCLAPTAAAQDKTPAPLRLDTLNAGALRMTVTEAYGAPEFTLTNLTDQDRRARVLVFYEGREDLQYGRDVWVPARATINSWLLAGPAPRAGKVNLSRDYRVLLYDRTGGSDVWVPPATQERTRSGSFPYRKREASNPYAALVLDAEPPPDLPPFQAPPPPSYGDEVNELVSALRAALNYATPAALQVSGEALPADAEAYDSIDHLVIASNRVAAEPAGLRAARQWLMRGGTAWVLLDRVDPDAVAPLLGDALDFQLVDRLSLTAFRVEPRAGRAEPEQQHEQPVGFARVLLPAGEEPRHALDGWPVWFTRTVGRGKVVFTTLGPRGWTRPRRASEKPVFAQLPNLPVARGHLDLLSEHFLVASEGDPFRAEELAKTFRQPLADQIGYAVPDRGTVAAVFAGFLAAALAAGLVLYRAGRREWLGWLAPAAALLAAGVFVVLGERSRRAVPPTVAVGQVVDVAPGVEEASVRGVLAAYRPQAGPAELAAERGGLLEMDLTGSEGQTRRLMTTDLGAWRFDGLSLPAGVRLGAFRHAAPTSEPIRAAAAFGPDGLEGKLSAGPFRNASDAVLLSLNERLLTAGERQLQRPLAVSLSDAGDFRASSRDALPPNRYLAGTLLSDRQQRRQELYRKFLTKPPPSLRGRSVLLAWADPVETYFRVLPGARQTGDALLVLPLEFRPTETGRRVTVPGPLLTLQRLREGVAGRVAADGPDALEQHLRFQLPAAAWPLKVERVRLVARIEAPARRVSVAARQGEAFAEVYNAEASPDPVRIEIDRPELLRLDDAGGLHLRLGISDLPAGQQMKVEDRPETRWKIHYLELEVVGTRP